MTVAELIRELAKMPPHVQVCVLDDQGFPQELAAARFRADLNVFAIESRSTVPEFRAEG